MKLACLSDFPYWDGLIGSHVRYQSLCMSLARVCDLTMIATVTPHQRYDHSIRRLSYRVITRPKLKEIYTQIGCPKQNGVPPDKQLEVASISHLVAAEGFDAVLTPYFNRDWMLQGLPADVVRIIDTHDCQSQRTRSFLRHGMVPTLLMTPEREGRELDRYDIALVMSDEDHSEFATMTDIPLVTAPFRLPPNPVYRSRPEASEVLFIAAKSDVNSLTLNYLLQEILPLTNRPLNLHLVGSIETPEAHPSNVNIRRHVDIDDVSWIYGAVDLAVNPTFAGGGVKTKTLEAIRYGVPILTSDEGARGLRGLLPPELIVNDKERFAWSICALLDDRALRERLSRDMIARLQAEGVDDWLAPFAQVLQASRSMKLEAAGTQRAI